MPRPSAIARFSFACVTTACVMSACMLTLYTPCATLAADGGSSQLVRTFTFDQPKLLLKRGLTTVEMADLPSSTTPREAMLPFRPVRLLVPWGKSVAAVTVAPSERTVVAEDLVVAKAPSIGPRSLLPQRQRRLLRLYPKAPRREQQPLFPAEVFSSRGVQTLNGYRFVDINLNPVQYDSRSRQLWSIGELTVTVDLVDDDAPPPPSPRDDVRARVAGLVENPEVLTTYDGHQALYAEPLDYLIITRAEFANLTGPNTLADFVDFLAGRSVRAAIVTVEDLLAQGDRATSAAARIRAGIRRIHAERGISYVLLAGDAYRTGDGGVPAPTLFAEFDWEGQAFRADLAADVYYALLAGELDHDGDGHNGEPGDGTDGQDVDLYAEVAVGRLPVDSRAQLERLVARTKTAYAIADEGTRRKILFAGENLFPGVWGRQYMEELEFGASTHGFVTVGVPAEYAIDHLFDKRDGHRGWSSRDLIARINGGIYQLHHIGHSATYMTMRCYSSSLNGLTTDDPFMVYTQGCHGGRFTVDDCIVEQFMLADHGAFACFANSNYGLGPEDPDDDATVVCRGASQYFHRQFMHAFWQNQTRRLGELNQRSKEANVPFMHHGTTRWVFWEMNLLGDPNLPLVR